MKDKEFWFDVLIATVCFYSAIKLLESVLV